jgi:hypothetical protein
MAVTRLKAVDIEHQAVKALLLPANLALSSREGIAASIRRAASFTCPTTSGSLVRITSEVLRGLPGFDDETPQVVAPLIEDLCAYGDLLELPVEDEAGPRRKLFLGPPSYVCREGTNTALVTGIRSEGAPLLSDALMGYIEYTGHARLFRAPDDAFVDELLDGEGLAALSAEQWLHAPREATTEELVAFYMSRLESQGLPGEVELRVLDPSSSTTYYRGRWRSVKNNDTGLFVGRRPQAFGADLWCIAQITEGTIGRLIDLPLENPLAPGADEAWRLQAALDASRGNPQRVRVTEVGGSSRSVLEFFSPVPSWLQRRLDVVGTPCSAGRGALFTYEIASDELQVELAFLASMLWLSTDTITKQ